MLSQTTNGYSPICEYCGIEDGFHRGNCITLSLDWVVIPVESEGTANLDPLNSLEESLRNDLVDELYTRIAKLESTLRDDLVEELYAWIQALEKRCERGMQLPLRSYMTEDGEVDVIDLTALAAILQGKVDD